MLQRKDDLEASCSTSGSTSSAWPPPGSCSACPASRRRPAQMRDDASSPPTSRWVVLSWVGLPPGEPRARGRHRRDRTAPRSGTSFTEDFWYYTFSTLAVLAVSPFIAVMTVVGLAARARCCCCRCSPSTRPRPSRATRSARRCTTRSPTCPTAILLQPRVEAALDEARRDGTGIGAVPPRPRPVQGGQRHPRPPRRRRAARGRGPPAARVRCAPSDTVARLGGDEFAVLLPDIEHPSRRDRGRRPHPHGARRAVPPRGRAHGRRRQHRHRAVPAARRRRRGAHAARRRRDVRRQGRAHRHRGVRRRARPELARPARHRRRRCATALDNGRPRAALPAQGLARRRHRRRASRRWCAGTTPSAACVAARRVRPAGRAHRAHPPAHRVRAAPRRSTRSGAGGASGCTCRWPSTSRMRDLQETDLAGGRRRRARRRTGCPPRRSCSRSPRACWCRTRAGPSPRCASSPTSASRSSLDDFGTGYSSLLLLEQLPVAEIKIDRSFVRRLDESGGDPAMVRSIVDFAHGLGPVGRRRGRRVVAGLEACCARSDCDVAQGYRVARPMPADAGHPVARRARRARPGRAHRPAGRRRGPSIADGLTGAAGARAARVRRMSAHGRHPLRSPATRSRTSRGSPASTCRPRSSTTTPSSST